MAYQTLGLENVLKKARQVHPVDLDNFYDKILKNTQLLENLRQLFLTLHCTRLNRRLPEEVGNALLATACNGSSEPRIAQLCSLILQEASPFPALEVEEVALTAEPITMLSVLPVVQMQGAEQCADPKFLQKLLTLLENAKLTGRNCMRILAFVHHLTAATKRSIVKALINQINGYLSDVLKNTSIYQASKPHSSSLFRKSEFTLVTELDGISSKEFFTVLSSAQYNTEDQFSHISSFCLLKSWLMACANQYSCLKHPDLTVTMQELTSIIAEYCLRVIDQCDRQAKMPQDVLLQQACLLECIGLLDLACTYDPLLIPSIFTTIKRVHAKLLEDYQSKASYATIVIAVLQYILHHGDSVAYDVQGALAALAPLIAANYHNISLSFEIVQFLILNLDNSDHIKQFVKEQFPNILKILAWHPRTFLWEFITLLPYFLTPRTFVEVCHSLLDLPCLSASLMLSLHVSNPAAEVRYSALPPHLYNIVQHFSNPFFHSMFSFVLRNSSGVGDSFSRLNKFHEILEPMSTHIRISSCCDVVPLLLNLYFQITLEQMDLSSISRLLPALLERVKLIYAAQGFSNNIKRIMAEAVYKIFKAHPVLVVEERSEILEYLNEVTHAQQAELFFMHVVWAVGEYSSTTYHADCSPIVITAYYESLECIFYEVLPLLVQTNVSCKLITAMIMTLVKLATRCQDLMPRAMLCLTKITQFTTQLRGTQADDDVQILSARANHLQLLLQMPSVATAVLSPPRNIDEQRWHLNNCSIPFVLKSVEHLLDTNSGQDTTDG